MKKIKILAFLLLLLGQLVHSQSVKNALMVRPVWNMDADAQAFFNAAGITNSTQIQAVNNFVIGIKAAGIWSKMYAIYPVVGGTASTHKWNLKDPRDLNAAYRLLFVNSPTHAANGITWNGTSQYAHTYFNPSLVDVLGSNISLSYYAGQSVISGMLIGCFTSVGLFLGDGSARNIITQSYNKSIIKTDHNSIGFWQMNRTSSTYLSLYENGNKVDFATTLQTLTPPNAEVLLGQLGGNSGAPTPGYYCTNRCQFASIGQGLTDLEAVTFTNLVNTLQADLGRNVFINSTVYWFMGNSITAGQAATTFNAGYPGTIVISRNVIIENLAVAGYTSSNLLNNEIPLLPAHTANQKYLFCAIGVNDVKISFDSTNYKNNLIASINAMKAKGYDSTNIIIPTLFFFTYNNKIPDIEKCNAIIKRFWDTYHLVIRADVYNFMVTNGPNGGRGYLYSDSLHMNNAGHTAVGNYYLSILP